MFFFKKKPKNIVPEQPTTPEINKNVVLSVYATLPDGTTKELPSKMLLEDGTCLVAPDGKYFHLIVACTDNYTADWRLIPIEEAEEMGLEPCFICMEDIYYRENHMFDYREDDDDE